VTFTKNLPSFGIEAFALHIFFAKRTIEALGVVVVVEGLHPSIPGLDGESTRDALSGEQFVPVFFAVREAVFQIEGTIGEDLIAVGAGKALRVEGGGHRLQAVPNNLLPALLAIRCQISTIALFTI